MISSPGHYALTDSTGSWSFPGSPANPSATTIQPVPTTRECPMSNWPRHRWYLPLKGVCDRVLGLVLLVLFSPIIAVCALLVKLTSPGPVFYRQVRVGLDGQEFNIIKIRSMRTDAEAETGAVWCREGDSRITWIGRILRSTHLDEFPQLINVVRGEMSLVGPRPERPHFVQDFEKKSRHYSSRHLVRPGITGIAQLRLPADSDLDSVRDKLEFDLFYVRHVSPWLDVVTLVGTFIRLFRELMSCVIPSSLRVPTQKMVREDLQQRLNGTMQPDLGASVIRMDRTVSGLGDLDLRDSAAGPMVSAS